MKPTTPIAFLHPRRLGRQYRADAMSAVYRRALAEAGMASVRIEVLLTDPGSRDEQLARLQERLRALGVQVAVLEHGFSEAFLACLRAGGVRQVLVVGRPSERARPGVDLSLPRSSATTSLSSEGFCEELRALLHQGPQAPEPASERSANAAAPPETPFVVAQELRARRPLWEDEERIGGAGELVEAARWESGSVLVDLGCPYRRRQREPAALAGVSLPTGCPRSGCSFCERPRAEAIPVKGRIGLALAQLRHLAEARPALQRVQIVDESFLGYVDRFARALVAEGLPGRDLLFSARPDMLLRQRERLERALAILGASHRLVLFCLGVENFSARELALFNKGFSPQQAIEALGLVEALRGAQPGFVIEPSFGFILMNPWTRLEDLLINWKRMRAVDFTRFREGVLHSRLRLYPEVPLYHRAKAEGLLLGDARRGGIDYGYGDADYRFVDPSVQRVHDQIASRSLGGDDLEALGGLCREELKARAGRRRA